MHLLDVLRLHEEVLLLLLHLLGELVLRIIGAALHVLLLEVVDLHVDLWSRVRRVHLILGAFLEVLKHLLAQRLR